MSLLQQWNASACAWILARIDRVSVAIAASLMVIVGGIIIKAIRKRIRTWHFAARTAVFVSVSGIGFGLIVALTAPRVSRALRAFGSSYVLVSCVAAFVGIGLLAERRRQI